MKGIIFAALFIAIVCCAQAQALNKPVREWTATVRAVDEAGQRDDRVHVLSRLVPRFRGGESQREGRATVEGQLDRMIEMAVKGLQDEERIIHGA